MATIYCRLLVGSKYDLKSPNPKKIATKHFFALTALMGHSESQKKSLGESDPGNRVNLHIFKMATIGHKFWHINRYNSA